MATTISAVPSTLSRAILDIDDLVDNARDSLCAHQALAQLIMPWKAGTKETLEAVDRRSLAYLLEAINHGMATRLDDLAAQVKIARDLERNEMSAFPREG